MPGSTPTVCHCFAEAVRVATCRHDLAVCHCFAEAVRFATCRHDWVVCHCFAEAVRVATGCHDLARAKQRRTVMNTPGVVPCNPLPRYQ